MTVHLHDYGQVGVGSGGAPINYSDVSRLILAGAFDPRLSLAASPGGLA